jgi:hypothetical protein
VQIKKQYIIWFSYFLLAAGAITRIIIFFQNRSFFLDEANLARNVVEKSPGAFFQPLDYEQYAPPLFLLLQKLNVLWLGATEYGVRFFPLLAGLISVFLFYKISHRFLKSGLALLFVLFLFSFGEYYLHFGTEGKQYSSDIMFTLLLIELALNEKGEFNWKAFFKWMVIGVVVIWFSMPSVFVLSGVGIYFLIKSLPEMNRGVLLKQMACYSIWIISFALYYFSILRTDVESDYLQNFHNDYFLPLLPSSLVELRKVGIILISLIKTTVGHTFFALVLGVVGVFFGLLDLNRNHRKEGLLLVIPVIVTLLASGLNQYSLIPRLTLFFIPLLLIITGIGMQRLFSMDTIWAKMIVALFVLVTASVHDGVKYSWQRYEIEEVREVLNYIEEEKEEEDLIYVNHNARPAVYFYIQLHKNKGDYHFKNIKEGDWYLAPDLTLININDKPVNRVWVVYSHMISEAAYIEKAKEMKNLLQNFKLKKEMNFKGAEVVLLERI